MNVEDESNVTPGPPSGVPPGAAFEVPLPTRWRAWLIRLGGLLWLFVLGAALLALNREWSGFHWRDLAAAFAAIGPGSLFLALGFAALSYGFNAALSLLAQRSLGLPLARPWRDTAIAFIYSAFSMNAGGSVLGGGSIRMRFAAAQKMTAGDIGRLTVFVVTANWAGHALLCGLLLLVAPPPIAWLQGRAVQLLAVALVVAPLALAFGGGAFKFWRGKWPQPAMAAAALLASVLDWLCAGLALWALLHHTVAISALSCVLVVVIAHALGAVTHIPGGVGVFELTSTKLLAGALPVPVLVGALVTYRLVYYVVPFFSAIVLLGARELWVRRSSIRTGAGYARRGWNTFAPRLGAFLALGGGFLLLLSANTPMEPGRRQLLAEVLPLPFVEASHFLSSLVGALLIVLAQGLRRRINAAWWLAILLTGAGIAFSLLKGFDWEEALALSVFLACLLPFRKHFYRHAAIWSYRFTAEWWMLLVGLGVFALWVGFFTHRHVDYATELWWRFEFRSDASRFLRAAAGAGFVFLFAALAQLLRPSRPRKGRPPVRLEEVERVVALSRSATAALAFLGDKQFEFSKDGSCFLMYADHGRSRVVMGEPVGEMAAKDNLLWSFIERAQDEGMRPVFYQVSVAEMPHYVDMGFKLFKLGQEARVPLESFTLEGPAAKKLRQTRTRCLREGFSFVIWDPATVAKNLAALRAVSDAWLAAHQAPEKSFSIGRFDDEYMRRFPCAVVLSSAGAVVAFANLWQTTSKDELSVDLMRHTPDAPGGTMDFLFAELMLWGKAQGFREFNLGMAPLSGLSTHPLAPLWNKAAAQIFRRGENLYNFRGLYDYKDKFHPRWEPRYLALPSAWGLPAALYDVTALISGGLRAVTGKRGPSRSSAV